MNTYNVHMETTNRVWEEMAARKDKELILIIQKRRVEKVGTLT